MKDIVEGKSRTGIDRDKGTGAQLGRDYVSQPTWIWGPIIKHDYIITN